MSKDTALWLLGFLTTLNLLIAGANSTLAIVTPSVPQFTISFEAHPYYVPPVYGTDPYTGANITVSPGYTVNNQSMVFTIKNQAFTPYTDENGTAITLTYVIRGKGHFENNWKEFERIEALPGSDYTEVSYGYDGNNIPNIGFVPNGGQVDYQVEARIGYYTFLHQDCVTVFTGQTSGWSPTTTLTIGKSQTPTPSPTMWPTTFQTATPIPSPSPGGETQTGIGLVEIVVLVIAAFILGVGVTFLIYLLKRK